MIKYKERFLDKGNHFLGFPHLYLIIDHFYAIVPAHAAAGTTRIRLFVYWEKIG